MTLRWTRDMLLPEPKTAKIHDARLQGINIEMLFHYVFLQHVSLIETWAMVEAMLVGNYYYIAETTTGEKRFEQCINEIFGTKRM